MDMGVVALIVSNEPCQLGESPYSHSRRVAPAGRQLTEGLQRRLRPRPQEPTERTEGDRIWTLEAGEAGGARWSLRVVIPVL
jgi:hypothetical protein